MGRTSNLEQLNIAASPVLLREVRLAAETENMKLSAWIREALRAKLARSKRNSASRLVAFAPKFDDTHI